MIHSIHTNFVLEKTSCTDLEDLVGQPLRNSHEFLNNIANGISCLSDLDNIADYIIVPVTDNVNIPAEDSMKWFDFVVMIIYNAQLACQKMLKKQKSLSVT